jgi:hypothetical protein
MGIIKPPWITEEWFQRCPFNYCDHFGDKKELALMCVICRDEIKSIEEYKMRSEDPYAWKNVFKDIEHNFALTVEMVKRDAEKMGIDLDNIPDGEYQESPNPNRYKIYRLVRMYGDQVGRIIENLEFVPEEINAKLVIKAFDVLSHSRSFVIVKIARALNSRWEEKRDKFDNAQDSKTSAFMSYVAIERNFKAFMALAAHKPLILLRKKYLKMAKLSMDLMDLVKENFFSEFEPVVYEEFGCGSFDKILGKLGKGQSNY